MQKLFSIIIHEDCIEEMKKLPNNSVDLIFVDPLYYLQLPKGKRLKRVDGLEVILVDNELDSFESDEDCDNFTYAWISECQRILKSTGTFWAIEMYHNIFQVGTIMQNFGLCFLNDVIWIKTDVLPNIKGHRFTNNHRTLIWSVTNKDYKKHIFNYDLMKKLNGSVQMKDTDWVSKLCKGKERLRDGDGIKAHLCKKLLLAASNKNDIIFDPFMDSDR